MGYFDEASQLGLCGGGMVLKLHSVHSFHLLMGCGVITNTREKLWALLGLIELSFKFGIVTLHVLGDSKVIVDWEIGIYDLHVIILRSLVSRN